MHPTVAYEITRTRIADQQHQAEQNAIVCATRRTRSTSTLKHPRPAVALAGRVFILLAARDRAAQVRSGPQAACSPPAPCTSCT